ncbi:MAG: STAS domain-containing protein [Casimicrobiaceae bacterium]
MSARELAAQVQDKRRGDARNVARNIEPTGEITVTGVSLIEWPNAPLAMEVTRANPGLCAVLENAALLYAGGQTTPARALLEEGVQNDYDAKQSALAWLALFDILQRIADRAAFEQLALQYVVQFERSAPAWDETAKLEPDRKVVVGGYVPITGKLTAASLPQIENLKRTIAKNVPGSRLDLTSVTGCDDAGARLLAAALAEARKRRFSVTLQRPEKLRTALDTRVKKGRDGGEGAWLLSLELLQFMYDQIAFDDRAIEYAIAFELSPPSWEPPPRPETEAAPAGGGARLESGDAAADVDMLVFNGVMAGSNTPQLAQLHEFAQRKAVVPIDMTAVERIDFVAAGGLVNAINRIETQRKAIQFIGVSPIIRAMLLLIGVSPRHFVKKG